MSGRFVRASKYRHVFGRPTKKEQCYDNLRISSNAWDTNLIKVNPKYLSVNWQASGGGAFAIIPLEERGREPEVLPLFRGHTAAVLDTDFSPFNDDIVASASDDGKVFLWKVPENFSLHSDQDEPTDVSPVGKLSGHSRKVGHVCFNPAAENVLASSSGDYTVKLWDLEDGQSKLSLKHNDIVQSLSWSANGSMLVTTSRDKKIRWWDVRQEKPAHEVPGHTGAKNSRCAWMGDHDRVVTTGFSRMSDRQLGLWDVRNPAKPVGGDFTYLDSVSGVCMPFWDDGCQILYLAGKGDGNIRYFEYDNDKFEPLSEYKSPDPQRGIAFMPRRGVNTHENEVMRAYKTVNDQYIEPISFIVPRRAEVFQDDIYPPAVGTKPAMSSSEWLDGKTGLPPKLSMEDLYEGNAPKEIAAEEVEPPRPAKVAPAPASTPAAAPPAAKEPEPAAAAPREQPSMQANKNSMSAMASKFADKDAESSSDEEDDSSSFEKVEKPAATRVSRQEEKTGTKTPPHAERTDPEKVDVLQSKPTTTTAAHQEEKTGTKTPPHAEVKTQEKIEALKSASPSQPSSPATGAPTASSMPSSESADKPASTTASSAAGGLKEVLGEIRGMLQAQGKQIESLTNEVAQLKAKVDG
ncbi:hypothetical protein MBLNU230_g7865t1 [Neophaeotheca triangularis]